MNIDQEIVLGCAFRYALGRMTYVVNSVCSELKRNYNELSESFKSRISKEIQEYQDANGKAGMDMDDDEWNKIKWLFNSGNKVKIRAKYHNKEQYIETEAIKGENGKYYSIPEMKEYHTVEEI